MINTLKITNYALDVTLCGLVIVFAMLIILVILISIFGKIMYKATGQKKQKNDTAPSKSAAAVSNEQRLDANSDIDDEIVAVISAAVAAMYEGTGKRAVIRTIRPTSSRPAWAAAGIAENMRSFY